jgi:putative ABC transport system permease protein
MSKLAWRNMYHDKVRFGVTLTGIVFAIVLICVQIGLFLGFTTTTSNNIDNSNVDLWIVSKGVTYFDGGTPFSERKLYQALAIPGVAAAAKEIVEFVPWQKPDGGKEVVLITGFDLESGLGGPWSLAEGSYRDLESADTVFIDEYYRGKLGVSRLGESVEINGRRARVAGFTRGIRSFTTSPYVYTSFKNALNYARYPESKTTFILVRAEPGADLETVRTSLLERVGDVDVYTTPEFARRTQVYWMFGTGAGIALLIAAVMGLFVGVVIVAQTIYATTMDHIREFGTLKAMGASNRYIHRVIIRQAVIASVIGYSVAIAVAQIIVRGSEQGGAPIKMPLQMAIAMFVVALVMCISASLVSIHKVTRLDPAMVFKG